MSFNACLIAVSITILHCVLIKYGILVYSVKKVSNILRCGSTNQNQKKSNKREFGNVQPNVHSWHLLQEILNVTSVEANTSLYPNLNPIDFWLWGHLKTLIYVNLVNDADVHTLTYRTFITWLQLHHWSVFEILCDSLYRT